MHVGPSSPATGAGCLSPEYRPPNPYPTMPLSHLAPWQCPDAGTGFSGHQLRRIRVQLLLATWPLSSAACGRDQSLKKEKAKLKALVVNRDPRNTRSPHLDQFSPSWLTWFQNQNPRESYPWIQNSILGSGSGTACTSPGIFRSARTSSNTSGFRCPLSAPKIHATSHYFFSFRL